MSLRSTYNKYSKQNKDPNSDSKLDLKSSSGTIVLLAAFFVSCAIMFYVASPLRREVKIIRFTNEAKTEDIEVGKSLLLKIIKINNKNKRINNEEVKKIGGLIPNRDNYEDYLTHIVNLAISKNIRIDNFAIIKDEESKKKSEKENERKKEEEGEEENERVFNKISIDIAASGGFFNFMSFARDIENGVPFIYEKSISISEPSDSENEEEGEVIGINTDPILNYEMSIEFYYY